MSCGLAWSHVLYWISLPRIGSSGADSIREVGRVQKPSMRTSGGKSSFPVKDILRSLPLAAFLPGELGHKMSTLTTNCPFERRFSGGKRGWRYLLLSYAKAKRTKSLKFHTTLDWPNELLFFFLYRHRIAVKGTFSDTPVVDARYPTSFPLFLV